MDIKFKGMWSKKLHEDHEIKMRNGYLLLKIDKRFLSETIEDFLKLNNLQESTEIKELEVKISVPSKSRTLDQNALMWALYRVMANEHNAGQRGAMGYTVTAEELYEADLIDNAPRFWVDVPEELHNWAIKKFRVIKKERIPGKNIFRMQTVKGSSEWSMKEMALWITNQFNRLANDGVSFTKTSQIKKYWLEFRENLDKRKIILWNTPMSIRDYKILNPVCEADPSDYLGHGGGSLAHIRSVASEYGYREFEEKALGGKDMIFPGNVLHLCDKHHMELDHHSGYEKFMRDYPHLKPKFFRRFNSRFPQFPEKEIDSVDILAMNIDTGLFEVFPRKNLNMEYVEICRLDDTDTVRDALADSSKTIYLPIEFLNKIFELTGIKPVEIHEKYWRQDEKK